MVTPSKLSWYELQQLRKLRAWQRRMQQPPSAFNRTSFRWQRKFNSMLPDKLHDAITKVVRTMVETVLFTSEYVKPALPPGSDLQAIDAAVEQRQQYYRSTAAVEGGITGFGGFFSALADFPALLAIKLKFLFDVAALYGHDTRDLRERIYLLYVFQLAFSNPVRRAEVYSHIAMWSVFSQSIPADVKQFDWYQFQQQYRDYLDIAKLMQMIPGIGAAVGIVVNYRLLNQLGETARQCYHMRWLAARQQEAAGPAGDPPVSP